MLGPHAGAQPVLPAIGFLHSHRRRIREPTPCNPSGPQRHRLRRGRRSGDRIPLGRQSTRPAADAGGRFGSAAGRRDRDQWRYCRRRWRPRRQPRRSPWSSVSGEEPVRVGLVAPASPEWVGNVTGISFFAAELAAKPLELLRELVPATTRIAVLVNPANAAIAEPQLRDAEAAARAKGLQIRVLNASTSGEINAAFASFERERPDALLVGGDPFFSNRRLQLALLAARHAVPASYASRDYARIRRADELRSQYYGGASSARRLYLAASSRAPNRRTCRSSCPPGMSSSSTPRPPGLLGLTVPPQLLATADEVIE